MSMYRAPSRSALATVCCWSSSDVLVRSKCIRFWPAFSFSVGRNRMREPGVIARQERDAVFGGVGYLPAKDAGPETRETEGVDRVEAECDEVGKPSHSAPPIR